MRRARLAAVIVPVVLLAAGAGLAQGPPGAVLYEGARILDGNGGAPIENGVLLVQNGRIVESADIEDLFAHPQHDYTRRLIASTPNIAREVAS